MQSSVGLAFRALVMLGCLALVPFLAMYGKQLPDWYHSIVDAYKARTHQKTADALADIGKDAPAWAPTNDRRSTAQAETHGSSAPPDALSAPLAKADVPPPLAPSPLAPSPWSGKSAIAQPIAAREQLGPARGIVQPASFARPVDTPAAIDPAALTNSDKSFDNSRQSGGIAANPAADTPSGDSCTQFRAVESRLRELGAKYYFLEMFGDGYRFYCEASPHGKTDPGGPQKFLAIDADPLTAMKKVLSQVEAARQQDTGSGYSLAPQR